MKNLVLTFTILSSLLLAGRAEGAEPQARGGGRVDVIQVGDGLQVVEHRRRPGELGASFRLQPGSVPEGAQVTFEVISVRGEERSVRWRCVAVQDFGECFEAPALVMFLPGDEALRLEVQLVASSPNAFGPLQLALAR